jgi:hypothetical protein
MKIRVTLGFVGWVQTVVVAVEDCWTGAQRVAAVAPYYYQRLPEVVCCCSISGDHGQEFCLLALPMLQVIDDTYLHVAMKKLKGRCFLIVMPPKDLFQPAFVSNFAFFENHHRQVRKLRKM